jgi:predicted ATP-grasp superfamily ATP-dependent carboligase
VRLFVSEYVCSGAWPDTRLPRSLAREGRAMLMAFADDCARVPDCEVVITWDALRFGAWKHAGVRAVSVSSPTEEWRQFLKLSAECDATYVIAPELDNLLAARCQAVLDAGGNLLNSSPEVIELCSDKLELAAVLERIGVATIPTRLFDPETPELGVESAVVKPRFGAGSQNIFEVGNLESLRSLRKVFAAEPETRQGIVQPWVSGTAASAAALFGRGGECRAVLPPAEQVLSLDQRFRYLGGRIPFAQEWEGQIARTIRQVGAALGLFRGYVGFDFIVDSRQGQPVLVEINPRLTTSYIGYRQLSMHNLAELIVSPARGAVELPWRPGVIAFSCDGRLIESDW